MASRIGRTPPFTTAGGGVVPGSVAEAGFRRIGGVDQWVMIRGRDTGNPLLVVLHGGPGSPETAPLRAFNAPLEDAYTVVYWEQRGAGRSYSPSIPPGSMTVERFLLDLDELVDSVLARFGKPGVVLLGHSWGSFLGVLYTRRHPDKVDVYVGVGQVADMAASEAASYAFTLETARERGNRKAVRQLLAIGPPPHSLKALKTQRRWLTVLGGAFGPNLSLAKLVWRSLASPEASALDLIGLARGSGFSLRLLWDELFETNLMRDVRRLEVPVILMLGRLDQQVVASVSAAWFDVLEAPHKALIWFEASGHMVPFEEPERFNRLMVESVRPFGC